MEFDRNRIVEQNMLPLKCTHVLLIIAVLFAHVLCDMEANFRRYSFVIKETSYTRLGETKNILTVNDQFPGPTIQVHKGETIFVDVCNEAKHNITLHWHGVKQPRNPWSDGPEYITQCPIQAGNKFSQKVIFSSEEGTLWWHAHSDWSRATVHGAIIIYPKDGASYPFAKPHAEFPILLGEWWKEDIHKVFKEFVASGGQPRDSDAFTINGQPGDFYHHSKQDTITFEVEQGGTYLLRLINAALNENHFFGVANHNLTVVGVDASYTKPLTRDYIVISPGQTLDCLLHADGKPDWYYMAARAYVNGDGIDFNNTTTTAIVKYKGQNAPSTPSPPLPNLPLYNDTCSAVNFSYSLRSLNSEPHPCLVPLNIDQRIVSTISVNAIPCSTPGEECQGPNRTRLAASMNNISFMNPTINILEAYFYRINGVFGTKFPRFPPLVFNYTADVIPLELEIPEKGTQVKLVKFNSTLELVLQGTNLVIGIDHPMHLHGFNFYVVGWGFGNFDECRDPYNYNLVDPQLRNTIVVPKNGWAAIRFRADNPGVWFMHCHYERHLTWGMETVFIVRSGTNPTERVLPPPEDMPPC